MKRNKTQTDRDLRERVLAQFKYLQVPVAEDHLDAIIAKAERDGLGYLEFLGELVDGPIRGRHERAMERRIRAARFAERRTFESFDWEFNRKEINRVQFEQLGLADFVERRDNLIVIGRSGVGKSHLVQAIGMRVCALGKSVSYTTSARIIEDLTSALADRTFPGKLRAYTRPKLLIIDEFGFDRVERMESPETASLLYKVVDARYRKGSIALVTNLDFDAWGDYLGDAPLAMALLDRLVDQAVIVRIPGSAKSYRAGRAKQVQPGAESDA